MSKLKFLFVNENNNLLLTLGQSNRKSTFSELTRDFYRENSLGTGDVWSQDIVSR